MDYLFEALKTQSKLKSLTVEYAPSKMITKLNSFLTDRTSITYFAFTRIPKYDQDDDSTNIEIMKAVKSMKNLETLILREFKFSEYENYVSLSEAISGLANLTKLEISRYVSDALQITLEHSIFKEKKAIKKLFQSLMSIKLIHLNLDGAFADYSQLQTVASYLQNLTQLKTLSLRNNVKAENLGFMFIGHAIANLSNLENLDISDMLFNEYDVKSLGQSLANLHELKILNLLSDNNKFSSEGVISIAKSLEDKVKLEEFSIRIEESKSESKSLAILALAKALADKPNLKILSIITTYHGGEIDKNVLLKLVSSLANSTKLHTLTLQGGLVNDSNAEALGNSLVNTNIESLNLYNNFITIKGATSILDELGNSDKKIKMIDFNINTLYLEDDISIFKNSVVVSKNKLKVVEELRQIDSFGNTANVETFRFTSEEYVKQISSID